jgi:hypothetical protein
MARKDENKSSNSSGGRIKFRFVDIEMEGANESLAEGLRSLVTALSNGSAVRPITRVLAPKAPQVGLGIQPSAEQVDEPDVQDAEQQEAAVEEQPAAPNGNDGPGRQRRAPRAPKFLERA